MGQGGALGLPGVLEQAAGGPQGIVEMVAAEAGEVAGAELLGELAPGGVQVEFPGGPAAQSRAVGQGGGAGHVLGHQQLRWIQAADLPDKAVLGTGLQYLEAPAADVEGGKAIAPP